MGVMEIWVEDETVRRLTHASRELGRPIENLAEAAVEEAALGWANSNPEADHVPPKVKLTERQRTMLLASEPSGRDRETGAGVELWTGADYAVAKSLHKLGLGDVNGPGQPKGQPGLYFNNAEGLAARAAERA